MVMEFETIRDALITMLGNAEAGQYRTIGYQRQGDSAVENLDFLRSVRVFYREGEFPKSGASTHDDVLHHMSFQLELTVAKAVEADLTVIDNPSATPAQLTAAIAASSMAEYLADRSMDELWRLVFLTIMDARNIDLDLPDNVGTRWLARFQKGEPDPRGQYVYLTAFALFTCQAYEQVSGETGTAGGIFDNVIDLDGDDVEKTGVLVDNP